MGFRILIYQPMKIFEITGKELQDSGARHFVTKARHGTKVHLGDRVRFNSGHKATIGYREGIGFVSINKHGKSEPFNKRNKILEKLNGRDYSNNLILQFNSEDPLFPLFKSYLSKRGDCFYSSK